MGWPKGVPRKASTEAIQATPAEVSRSQMSTIESTGVQIANAKVVKPAVQIDSLTDEGTTDKLFPDFIPEQEEQQGNQPQAGSTPAQEQPEPEEQISHENAENKEVNQENVKPIEQQQSEQSNPKVLDLDQMGDYVVVQNINGQKREIKLRDLNRMDQTDAAITQKAQRVAEERRQLEALRQELRQQPQAEPPQRQEQQNISNRQAQMEANRIAQLEQQIAMLQQSLGPVMYQNNRQRLASELKADGFDDFLEYIPKIEQAVASVEDDNLFNYYNTPEGAKALYFQMKAKELKQSVQKQPDAPKPPVAIKRQSPPVVRVGSGDQSSNGVTDDWNTKYKTAMKFARENPGNREAIQELLRLKGISA